MKARLDHIGIAVTGLADALAFYKEALGLEVSPPQDVPSEHVRAVFVPVGESSLELLEATSPDSPIGRFVERHGPGLHHITLTVPDLTRPWRRSSRAACGSSTGSLAPARTDRAWRSCTSSAGGVLLELKQEPSAQ